MKELKAAGIEVVAVSYDPVATLKRFATRRDITFPLLADPESRVIECYGIRNREAAGSRIDGVPYPGTYLIDSAGVIRQKLFHAGYKERHTAADILAAVKALDRASPAPVAE